MSKYINYCGQESLRSSPHSQQDLLELTPQKDVLFIIGDWNAKEVKRYLE